MVGEGFGMGRVWQLGGLAVGRVENEGWAMGSAEWGRLGNGEGWGIEKDRQRGWTG